ncbi:hypothetical protein ACIQNK_39630 [Streptomyces sp. NPDC091273]|uniref:hypothetical protein n=1 Tax=Streptomyces sp. NPDC091273 TaxID=3365982 RepID=UPI00382380B8
MNIVENVVSGIILALLLWGARKARIGWRRRRAERGAGPVTMPVVVDEPVNGGSAASAGKE